VSGSYTIAAGDKVQALLTQLDNTFGATATIDSAGRLRIIDDSGGDSGMYVNSFITYSINQADPFGGGTVQSGNLATTNGTLVASDGVTPITTTTTLLTNVYDTSSNQVVVGDSYTFTGAQVDGTGLGAGVTFTVAGGDTIQTLLTFLETTYSANAGDVTAVLDATGHIRLVDNTNSGTWATPANTPTLTNGVGNAALPLGADGALALSGSITGQINISTSKREVVSLGQALSTASGIPPVISATTAWSSVFDANGNQVGSGNIEFSGTRGDNTPVTLVYAIDTAGTSTVQDMLDAIETAFDADATIDSAGRLSLRDRVADSSTYTSSLSIDITSFPPDTGVGTAYIFGLNGVSVFQTINGTQTEDGSQMGDTVSVSFEPEALASTQYANSSTTIFQDQDGFAAGFLQSVAVDTAGVITGNYSNGQVLKKAQVALASFNNMAGLFKEGGNIFRETTESGAPVTGAPGTNGLGSIAPNSLEQSNVDLGTEFVKLITTQRGFQANSKIITTTDEMLNELINLKR